MGTERSFIEGYEHSFSLKALEEGELDEWVGDTEYKNLMKFLIDNQDKKDVTEPKEPIEFLPGERIGDAVSKYLDIHIYPLPEYTEEELQKTNFEQTVSVSIKLLMKVDMLEDYAWSGAGYWDQGGCPTDDEEEFQEYVEENTKDIEILDEFVASDCIDEQDDPLETRFSPIADMIQWRTLSHMHYEFEEEKISTE